MRQQHFGVVDGRGAQEVLLAELTQLLAIHVLEEGRVDVHQAVFLDGPVQPLAHMLLRPQCGICGWTGPG